MTTTQERDRTSSRAARGSMGLSDFHTSRYIGGLTHAFYRYPATTSPEIVRELLLTNTRADDLVLDPFMGGGTTIVEALAHGRRALGSDLNSLSVFVTRAKTTPLSEPEWEEVFAWAADGPLRPGITPSTVDVPHLPGFLLRPVARALARTMHLRLSRQRALVRCSLLRTAQWALESSYLYPRRADDRRNLSPTLAQLESKFAAILITMREGMHELVEAARTKGLSKSDIVGRRALVKSAAEDLAPVGRLASSRRKSQLILTSPPYPNVHVLYHRWQIEGRRETSAPYWIAGQSDGATLSYYAMGSRTAYGQRQYFQRLEQAFAAARPFLRKDALVMQLVAFNDATEQLPRYLSAMERAGYRSCHARRGPTLVREVPNRRWYARDNNLDAGREYLVVHAPA